MIGQSAVKTTLGIDIALSSEMTDALELWCLMYSNQSPWLNTDIKSLNLAASIAAEIARAITIEMAVTLTGSPRAVFLQAQVDRVVSRAREYVEYGAAKGGLIFKPYVDNGQIAVNYVQADQFYPVAFDSDGNMTACVFADQRQIGQWYYTRLEYHRLTDAGAVIVNRAFRSSSKDDLGGEVPLDRIEEWGDILPEATITGVDRPLFAYFKYPLANNIKPSSPLGVSCYSRATDLIEQADRQHSRILWEHKSGERALYADEQAFTKDSEGKSTLPDRRLFRGMNMSGGNIGDNVLFQEWSPELRQDPLQREMNRIFQQIEFKCGLAYGTISDPQMIEKTATEIAASKQRSQATVVDGQKALQAALDHLLYAMDVYATLYSLAPQGAYQVAYDFDDSLITDKDTQRAQDRQDVTLGVMAKYRYLMKTRGLTEDEAKQWIAEAQGEQPQDFFNGA